MQASQIAHVVITPRKHGPFALQREAQRSMVRVRRGAAALQSKIGHGGPTVHTARQMALTLALSFLMLFAVAGNGAVPAIRVQAERCGTLEAGPSGGCQTAEFRDHRGRPDELRRLWGNGPPANPSPFIDRLAGEGMRLEPAIQSSSSSSPPNRASILAGRCPHATGAAELHMPLPATQILLTEPLRQAGYFTAAAGKWDLGPAAKTKFDRVCEEGSGRICRLDWAAAQAPEEQAVLGLAGFDRSTTPFGPHAAVKPHRGGRCRTALPAQHPEVREELALYYDAVAEQDAQVGAVLAELDRQGLRESSVVIFLAVSGRPFPRCEATLLDSGTGMPLIVRWPGGVRPGSASGSLVSACGPRRRSWSWPAPPCRLPSRDAALCRFSGIRGWKSVSMPLPSTTGTTIWPASAAG